MIRKIVLSVAAVVTLAVIGISNAEAGGCHRGGYGGFYGGPGWYGGPPVYRSARYYGGPGWYGGPGFYGGSGVSYYRGYGGYGRSYSGFGVSIGF